MIVVIRQIKLLTSKLFSLMEDLKIAVWIFSGVTMFTCLLFVFFFRKWEHRHPKIFTEKATPEEKLMYKKMTLASINTILLYIIIFLSVLTFMSEGNIPLAIWLVCGLGISYVVCTFISIFRKK